MPALSIAPISRARKNTHTYSLFPGLCSATAMDFNYKGSTCYKTMYFIEVHIVEISNLILDFKNFSI